MDNDEVDEALPLTVAGVERSEVYEAGEDEQHNETLGDLNVEDNDSDDSGDSEDEEPAVKVVLTANSYTGGGFSRRRFSKGANKIQASAAAAAVTASEGPTLADEAPMSEADLKLREELNTLRYSYHKTAFDVDIDSVDERPWREPGVDISDYFNYGFTEATWRIYAEKQLRLRAQLEAEGKLETKPMEQPAIVAPNKPNFSARPLEMEQDGHVESKAASPRGNSPSYSGGQPSAGGSRFGVPAVSGGGTSSSSTPSPAPTQSPLRSQTSASPSSTPAQNRGRTQQAHPSPQNPQQHVTRAPPIQPGGPPPQHTQRDPPLPPPHARQPFPTAGMNSRGPPPPFMPPHGMPPRGMPPRGMPPPPHMMPPGMDMQMPPYGMPPGMMMPHPGGFNHPPPPRDDRRRLQQNRGDYPSDRNKYQRSR